MKTITARWDGPARGVAFDLLKVEARREYQVPYHRHEFAEIFWLSRGECRHPLNGRLQTLRRGDLCFLRPADAHTNEVARDAQFEITNLMFSAATLTDLLRRHAGVFGPLWNRGEPFHMADDQLARLDELALQLARQPRDLFHLERFLYELAALLSPAPAEVELPPHLPDWLRAAIVEIHRPDRYRPGVAGLVKAAGRSHEHVAREIKRHLGVTPSEIVNWARVRDAQIRLTMTRRPITEIATESGFESQSQFFAVFRRLTGTTPLRYRRNPSTTRTDLSTSASVLKKDWRKTANTASRMKSR